MSARRQFTKLLNIIILSSLSLSCSPLLFRPLLKLLLIISGFAKNMFISVNSSLPRCRFLDVTHCSLFRSRFLNVTQRSLFGSRFFGCHAALCLFGLEGDYARSIYGLCNEDVYRWQGCIVGQFGAKDVNDAVFTHTQNSSVRRFM